MHSVPHTVTSPRRAPPPPFKVGDRVLFQRRPDGVEIVTEVEPCPSGRHHIRTRRQLGQLVEATRYAPACRFPFAGEDRGWRRRAVVPLKLTTLVGFAGGAWGLVAVTALAGLWLFRHV
jgi:hypothetical protein